MRSLFVHACGAKLVRATPAIGAVALVSMWACSPGPGRAPDNPDARPPDDSGARDATSYDALPYDGGVDRDAMIGVTDTGPKVANPFTGIFGILNSSDPLFAREVNGQLNLVVRDYPYVYFGTVANDGTVDTRSPAIMVNCAVATITGKYDRDQAQYVLTHKTCSAQGMPLTSMIMGGFEANFDPSYSGVYELNLTVPNANGCFTGQQGVLVRYGLDFLASGAMAVYTTDDVISQPDWYQGQAASDGSFSAISMGFAGAPTRSMMGSFMQATANDPLHFKGQRDIWDSVKRCSFTALLDGNRTVAP